jgi:hypothetical protein
MKRVANFFNDISSSESNILPIDIFLSLVVSTIGIFLIVLHARIADGHYPDIPRIMDIAFYARVDYQNYIKMALEPNAFFTITSPHHAQRVFPSLLVWVTTKLFNVEITPVFHALAGGSFLLTLLLVYWTLRCLKVSPGVAFGTTIFLNAHWPFRYNIGIIYQLTDAMLYPLALIMSILIVRKKENWFFLIGVISIFTRQNLLILACAGCSYLFFIERKKKYLFFLGVFISCFLWLTIYAGGGAFGAVAMFTFLNISLKEFFTACWETRVVFFLSPFVLVLMSRQTIYFVLNYWWITVYAVITILQPLTHYPLTGPDNAQRLFYQGLWPLVIVAGLILGNHLKHKRVITFYMILPFLYPIFSIIIFNRSIYDFQLYLNRQIPIHLTNFVVLGLVFVEFYLARDRKVVNAN